MEMRNYPTMEDWPKTPREAHIMLIRAYYHLSNSEKGEFETLDARTEINRLQNIVCGEVLAAAVEEVEKEVDNVL